MDIQISILNRQIKDLELQLEQDPIHEADKYNFAKRMKVLKIVYLRNKIDVLQEQNVLLDTISDPLPF